MVLPNRIYRYIFVLLLMLLLTSCVHSEKRLLAQNGVLDLSKWDFEQDGIVSLDGQWEFYWGKLLFPEDFSSSNRPQNTEYISLPMAWADYEAGGEKPQKYGYATYRLVVKATQLETLKALRLSKILSAYRLWVNGNLVASSGIVGRNLESETPKLSLAIAEFTLDRDQMEIVLQVSNHNYRGGGILTSISFGSAEGIRKYQNRHWALTLIILSGLLTMGVYHLILYLMRRKDLSPLLLGLYCLCWAVNNLFSSPSGWLISYYFPRIQWPVLYQIGISAYFLSNPVLMMFLYSLYSRECSIFAVRFSQVLGGVFCLFAFLLPVRLVVEIVPIYHLFSFTLIAYSVFSLIRAAAQHRDEALVILSGYLILALSGGNDMLHDSRIIDTAYLLPMGLFFFITFQAFALSMRFSKAFTSVENLSAELQQKNIELNRMDRIKDEFLANTSHELRTPLHGMIGIAESLLSSTRDSGSLAVRNSLELIVGSGQRLAHLVNDILDFLRLKHQDFTLDLQPQNLHTLTDNVLTLITPLTKAKSVKLVNSIPDDLPAVLGDQSRLQQVFYNLIGNAIKCTDQGRVEIRAYQQGAEITVCVEDTGVGIAPDQLETIFQPFEQAGQPAGRHSESSGLGLGICCQLVQMHGGKLSVESTLGEGSCFCFTLPCAPAQVADADNMAQANEPPREWQPNPIVTDPRISPAPQPPTNGIAPRILVVDDDPVNLQVVINHLTSEGMSVVTADRGEEALQILESENAFSLVLLDIMMPGIDGYEVCRRLRQCYSAAELPVLMLSARTQLPDLVQGLSCGANDYLPKPFAREELLARVRAQLKARQAHITLLENQHLKQEVLQRQQTEQDLRLTQHRLGTMLDSVPEAMLAVNENEEINFCNRAFEALTGHAADVLLGRPLRSLFPDESARQVQHWLVQLSENDNLNPQELPLIYADNRQHQHQLLPKALELEEEQLMMLIVRSSESLNGVAAPVALSLIESSNHNRNRLRRLEEALGSFMPQLEAGQPTFMDDLHAIDNALAQLGHALSPNSESVDQHLAIIEVMNLSVDCWCENTHSSKAELARQSGLWKVYTNDDGWDRTQTLDRYLSLETLPKYPRRKQVARTAEFVLASCHQDALLRQQLERALAQLHRFSVSS